METIKKKLKVLHKILATWQALFLVFFALVPAIYKMGEVVQGFRLDLKTLHVQDVQNLEIGLTWSICIEHQVSHCQGSPYIRISL